MGILSLMKPQDLAQTLKFGLAKEHAKDLVQATEELVETETQSLPMNFLLTVHMIRYSKKNTYQ